MILRIIMLVAVYLIGSVPTGYIMGRIFFGLDIRTSGSGNIGATNALRHMGVKAGIIVLILDMLKGCLAVLLMRYFFRGEQGIIALGAMVVILGHVFTVFLGFKGGKGVATAAGVFMILSPLSFLISILCFTALVLVWRYVSLASMISALVFYTLNMSEVCCGSYENMPKAVLVTIIVLVIIIKHRSNIGRLIEGTEIKIGPKKKAEN
ncbi:MAG: glycerol-3-phosphate 1-O-acyltransferase PlsY [Candidatus Cloacimonetes bacterium]|nr:glycerol-3-phosphate 1-O-acyltransferase PlsY [Candidatus Cloacimonadota bacterium]